MPAAAARWSKTSAATSLDARGAAAGDEGWKAFSDDGNLPENGLRIAIEEAKRVGKVSREVAFGEVADLSVLKETQKEFAIGDR